MGADAASWPDAPVFVDRRRERRADKELTREIDVGQVAEVDRTGDAGGHRATRPEVAGIEVDRDAPARHRPDLQGVGGGLLRGRRRLPFATRHGSRTRGGAGGSVDVDRRCLLPAGRDDDRVQHWEHDGQHRQLDRGSSAFSVPSHLVTCSARASYSAWTWNGQGMIWTTPASTSACTAGWPSTATRVMRTLGEVNRSVPSNRSTSLASLTPDGTEPPTIRAVSTPRCAASVAT